MQDNNCDAKVNTKIECLINFNTNKKLMRIFAIKEEGNYSLQTYYSHIK